MTTCKDCVWADECEDAKEDGWCEDFCLSMSKDFVPKPWEKNKQESV